MPETCGICQASIPFGDAIHLVIHTRSEEGVIDYFLCRSCYEQTLESKVGRATDPETGDDTPP